MSEDKVVVVTSGNSIKISGYHGEWKELKDSMMLLMGALLSRRDQCDDSVTIELSFKQTDKFR